MLELKDAADIVALEVAAHCLAWPVTSFIDARRRKGRGFEVEAKAGDAVSTPDS